MHKSSTNGPQSERLMEEAQKQDDVPDFGATFLASLYSSRAWDDTTGGLASKTKKAKEQKASLTQFFSPVYSAGKEPIGPPESTQTPLKVEELYAKKETPFEWTDEYMDLDMEKKVEAYNSIAGGMKITLHKDVINVRGHIRVKMAFIRPIEVVQRVVPSPVQNTEDMGKSKDKPTPTVKITETILPQNTTEVIDIDSKTTARQMIVKLFKNLRMVDYPRDYALFEYEPHIDEAAGKLTRKWTQISDDACPLKVVLSWPIPHCGRALVLQEKDNRDVQKITDEIEMEDIYSKVTGLKKKLVDVQIHEKSQTGLFETTLSKRVPSKQDEHSKHCDYLIQHTYPKHDELPKKDKLPKQDERGLFITIIIILLPICYILHLIFSSFADTRSEGHISPLVKGFLEKHLEEFLQKFLEEVEK